jgi:hypothetical protein
MLSAMSAFAIRRLILHVEPAKLLHALAGIDLGGKDIALSIDGDIVERRELADLPPRPTETAERLLRCAIDDTYFAIHAVDHVDEFLLLVG